MAIHKIFEHLLFYRKFSFICEASFYNFSNYLSNNTETWSNYRIISLSHHPFEGYSFGNSFTLRRMSIFSNKTNSEIKGRIQVNNQKSLTIDIILRPNWLLQLLLICILLIDISCLVINFLAGFHFYPLDLLSEKLFLQNISLIPFNLVLILNYIWFRYDFSVTLAKFKYFFPKEFNLKHNSEMIANS